MKKVILPLLLALLFIAESTIIGFLPNEVFGIEYVLVPRFLFIALLFLAIYGPSHYWLSYALIFGLLFDVVYTEIIGIYLFLFPVLAYFILKLMKIIQANIVVGSFAALFGVALLDLCSYGMNTLIHLTEIGMSVYLEERLLPSLILNLIFIIIMAYPMKKFLELFHESNTLS